MNASPFWIFWMNARIFTDTLVLQHGTGIEALQIICLKLHLQIKFVFFSTQTTFQAYQPPTVTFTSRIRING
jgi:hypothetical protein